MTDIVTPTEIPLHATALPDPSDRGTFTTRGLALFNYETGTMVPGMNTIAEQTHTNATAAFEAVDAAWINANFKGAWSGLAGALAKPALVSHAGQRWSLLNNLANVATSEPGVSADWELFQLPAASGIGFDPSGTSRTETNVQTMLTSVANDTDTALIEFENPILNGDMRVAQPGTSFSCAAGITRVIDGWLMAVGGAAVVTASQSTAPTPDLPSAKWLIATVTTADASIAASDYAHFSHRVEGFEAARYVDKTFTLGFWVKSSVTGIHGISLRNSVNPHSYIGQVNILAADTPQFATLTVTGGLPSAVGWETGNAASFELGFVLACGTSLQGAVGTWTTANVIAPAAQVNALGTIGNVFGLTDVQINPGAVAKRLKRPTYAASLARCQRYYSTAYVVLSSYGTAGSIGSMTASLPVPSRNATTVFPSVTGGIYNNCTFSSCGLHPNGHSISLTVNVTATGAYNHTSLVVQDARL